MKSIVLTWGGMGWDVLQCFQGGFDILIVEPFCRVIQFEVVEDQSCCFHYYFLLIIACKVVKEDTFPDIHFPTTDRIPTGEIVEYYLRHGRHVNVSSLLCYT